VTGASRAIVALDETSSATRRMTRIMTCIAIALSA
jgi:hypothetical protein